MNNQVVQPMIWFYEFHLIALLCKLIVKTKVISWVGFLRNCIED